MSIASYFFSRLYNLPPRHNRIRKHGNIRIRMDDGVELMADHYEPRVAGPHPTLLLRLPYGRNGFAAVARAYAEHGFHVLIQACRGTEKSGGEFDPLTHERADGLATLAWLRAQPWFDGRLGTTGPSYLGFTQWAICDAPEIKAMSVKVSSSEFRSVVFPSGAFHLGLWLSWLQTIEGLRTNPLRAFRRMKTGGFERRTERAAMTLPLVEADRALTGEPVRFWRRWFETAIEDGPFWQEMDHRGRLRLATAPNHLMTGWYDFMVDQLLRDYRLLVDAGHRPYLTVVSGTHISRGLEVDSPRDTIAWMRAHLLGDRSGLRAKPVRIQLSGTGAWYEFEAYPPAPADPRSYFLHGDGRLSPASPLPAAAARYRYDPADPTPNQGGAIFAFTNAGPINNAAREKRSDVLCYTSEVLPAPLTVLGQVRVVLYARTSRPHVDFFLRLCDVSPKGASINVTDGLVRMTPKDPPGEDGVWRIELAMHATGHVFKAGHRLRLQVSSGAHPRYARNLGTDEPIGTATTLEPVDVEIFHDPRRPTELVLPVYDLTPYAA